MMISTIADRVEKSWGEGSIRVCISHVAKYKTMVGPNR